jgi:hypothetical protein
LTDVAPTDETLLAEAQTALHRLLIGEGVVTARDSNGELVTYTPANASRLRAYIQELKTRIAPSDTGFRPLRPVF